MKKDVIKKIDVIKRIPEYLIRHSKGIALGNIALEQDIRAIWGNEVVDALLDIMDFKDILEWIDKPNEFFDNKKPKDVVGDKKSVEPILEFVLYIKHNGYL